MYGFSPHTDFGFLYFSSAAAVFVKTRVAGVEILAVELIRCESQAFTEALEVDNFSCAQEFYDIAYIGVIGKAENVIVGLSRLLLCGKVFVKVCQGITR